MSARRSTIFNQTNVNDDISDRQFFTQLAIVGLITQDEAQAYVSVGTIPSEMAAPINAIPTDGYQQFIAKMKFIGAKDFNINDPLVQVYAASQNPPWTRDQLRAFWDAAAAL